MFLSRDLLNIVLVYASNEYENKKKLNDEYSSLYHSSHYSIVGGNYECLRYDGSHISKMFNYRVLSDKWIYNTIYSIKGDDYNVLPKRYVYSNK